MDLMEPRLALYRIILVTGALGFFFSLKTIFFPSGLACIVAGVFTALYLWEEVMCSAPSRELGGNDDSEPDMARFIDPISQVFYHILSAPLLSRTHNSLDIVRFWVLLISPFFIWHITSFGIGYGMHKIFSSPIVKEYVVHPVHEVKSKSNHYNGVKIRNIKTYRLFSIPTSKVEFDKVRNGRNVNVDIDSYQSWFGLSFDKDFVFKTIKN